jgi:hypothetical protein
MTPLASPLHFLHLGKTGGTAVKHALRPFAQAKQIVLHGHPVRLGNVPVGEKVFFLLRDPLRRFVSAFYSRQRQGQPRYLQPWSIDEAAAFDRFQTPNELAAGLSSVSAAERKKAQRAMQAIGHVNSKYWDWLVSAEYLQSRADDIFFIGLQEDLTRDFEMLRGRLALPDGVALPEGDVDAHRSPMALDRRLGEAAARNLITWYAEDYVAIRECRRLARERSLGGAIVDAPWIEAGPRVGGGPPG